MTADPTDSMRSGDCDFRRYGWDVETALRRFCGERDDLREIAVMFLDYAPTHLRSLQESCIQQDFDAVRQTAHRLCGAAANLSAVSFEQTARRLEQAAGTDPESLPALMQQLNQAFDGLETLVRKL